MTKITNIQDAIQIFTFCGIDCEIKKFEDECENQCSEKCENQCGEHCCDIVMSEIYTDDDEEELAQPDRIKIVRRFIAAQDMSVPYSFAEVISYANQIRKAMKHITDKEIFANNLIKY